MKHIFLATLLFLPSLSASAEDFSVSGAGGLSCGKFMEDQKDRVKKVFHTTWVQGFLSGMNIADAFEGKKLLQLPEPETIDLYISNYCEENPLEHPYSGAATLFRELRSRDEATRNKP